MDWYYARGDARFGPLDDQGIRALAAAGKIKPGDLIWHTGVSEWQAAHTVPGLLVPPPLPPADPVPESVSAEEHSDIPGAGKLKDPGVGQEQKLGLPFETDAQRGEKEGAAASDGTQGVLRTVVRLAAGAVSIGLWIIFKGLNSASVEVSDGELLVGLLFAIVGSAIYLPVFYRWPYARVGTDLAAGKVISKVRMFAKLYLLYGIILSTLTLVYLSYFLYDPSSVVSYVLSARLGPLDAVIWAAVGITALILSHGLHNRAGWARRLALAMGIFICLQFPLGFLLASYTWWLLHKPSVVAAFTCSLHSFDSP